MAIMDNWRCRICGNPVEEIKNNKFFPFCSERCKTIDLGRWLSGDYSISEPILDDENGALDAESEDS